MHVMRACAHAGPVKTYLLLTFPKSTVGTAQLLSLNLICYVYQRIKYVFQEFGSPAKKLTGLFIANSTCSCMNHCKRMCGDGL